MLILKRKAGESVEVREPSVVTVLEIVTNSGKVRLGIEPLQTEKPLTNRRKPAYDKPRTSPQTRQ